MGEAWQGARSRAASAPRTAAALQAPSPQSLGGTLRSEAFFQSFLPTVSPRAQRNSDPWSPPPQGKKNSREFQLPFTEALSLVFAFRQTLRNPHKWPVRLPGSSRPCASCAHVYGSGEGERKRGVYCSQPRALFLLGPLRSQDRAARGFAASPPAWCAWWSWQRERPRKRLVSSLPLPYTTASR